MKVLLFFLALGYCAAQENSPTFEWLQKSGAFGVPLLKVNYPNGLSDRIILREVGTCIFNGILEKENTHVTLTGCPMSKDLQIQLSSSHLERNAFNVVNGIVLPITKSRFLTMDPESTNRDADDIGCHGKKDPKDHPKLSEFGYVMRIRAVYDKNWQDKFSKDSENAVKRVVAHTQHIFKWPSLGTNIILTLEEEMQAVDDRFNANMTLRVIGPQFAKDRKIHTNVIFTVRDPKASYNALGKSRPGGACDKDIKQHVALMEYEDNDIAFARSLAHELGHSLGISHDFCDKEDDPRSDSIGNTCTKIGSMMSYEKGQDGDKRHWSSCSVEDLERFMDKYPQCFEEYDSSHPPPALTQLPLTSTECDLRKYMGVVILNGYKQLGKSCMVLCIDGICAPTKCKNKGTTACERICGKTSC